MFSDKVAGKRKRKTIAVSLDRNTLDKIRDETVKENLPRSRVVERLLLKALEDGLDGDR